MKITVLGSGTSQGVPVIACDCHVCTSVDSRDKRLRCSILIEKNGKTIIIDAGPDFRQQMLSAQVKNLDAVVFTHEHKDHIAGLDDVRAFNFRDNRKMPIYCDFRVENALKREFHYAFDNLEYPGVPQLELFEIDKDTNFQIKGIEFKPFEVLHYQLPVLGFRIDDFVYITDAKTVANEEKQKLKNVDLLIVNALRIEEHISHFNLKEALSFIEELKPKRALLTHISHVFGTHEEIEKMLPTHVSVAYDTQLIYC
jgi:phosphoribosyl 1,2-cyclic phosphate phosphodiesterase